MMTMPALHSAAMLLLLPWTLTESAEASKSIQFEVIVKNSVLGTNSEIFRASMVYRGILLGALQRLMGSNANFRFTYTDNPNYGPYLESVNGVVGNDDKHTYWELLVEKPDGKTIRPDVGIGCYIPSANEKIILNFTRW